MSLIYGVKFVMNLVAISNGYNIFYKQPLLNLNGAIDTLTLICVHTPIILGSLGSVFKLLEVLLVNIF